MSKWTEFSIPAQETSLKSTFLKSADWFDPFRVFTNAAQILDVTVHCQFFTVAISTFCVFLVHLQAEQGEEQDT